MGLLELLNKLMRETSREIFDELDSLSTQRKPSSGKRKSQKNISGNNKKSVTTRSEQVYCAQSIVSAPFGAYVEMPEMLRRMRTLSGYNNLDGTRSMESLFYQQGKFMEYFTDNFPDAVKCSRTVPMYYNLSDHELRAYFTWRTQYRLGAKLPSQASFLLLYSYEILNLIGFSSAELAYDALGKLLSEYGEGFPNVKKLLLKWMPDFAAYYRLPYRLENETEAACITILRHSVHSAQELLLAFDRISKYHIKDSRLYLAQPKRIAEMFHAVYQALLSHYAEQKGQSFSAYLLGEQVREQHLMFEGAVFCNQTPQLDGSYRLSPVCVYHCCNGEWAIERYCATPHRERVGALLRTFDSIMREILKVERPLKPGELPDGDADVMRQAIEAWLLDEQQKNAPVITLDEAELADIRKAAAHTTDMLTLPEDEISEDIAPVDALNPQPVADMAADDDAEADDSEIPDLPLSKPAMALLICLVTGESYQPLIDTGHMISVLVDEINEALYDQIGDTVIEMQVDLKPVLIADYLEDVKGLLET